MTTSAQDDPGVDLVFEGQILAGFEREQVRRALGERFRLDDARLDRMFTGAPYVLKRGVAPADASRYIGLFAALGARLMAKNPGAAAAPRAKAAPPPAAPGGVPLALVPTPPPAAPEPAPPRPFDARRAHEDSRPYQPMVVVEEAHAPAAVFGVGFNGRLGRRRYAAAALFGWALIRWAMLALAAHPRHGTAALIGLGMVVAMAWTFRLTVLRLHDINLPGWWVLLGPVPVLGTLGGLVLSALPGSTGDNRFGEEPDEGSQWLRYVVLLAVVCIGAGFRHGLLFGNMAGAGSQAEVAELGHAPPDAAVAPTDDELNAFLKSAAARRDFREGYWPAHNHKAFASSDSGPSGWVADMGTAEAARAEALARCDKARDAYATECRIVQVDGDWAD